MNNNFTEKMLCELRAAVKNEMGDKRYNHTLEVEKMSVRLGEIYAPDKIPMLRAAALLHDVTKERSAEEHMRIFESFGISLSDEEKKSPKMFHARTAALIIPKKYPSFATGELIDAVRYHTTGKPDMSISEKIIYLADYIDMSRTFDDCIRLRSYFFSFDFESASAEESEAHLRDTLIMSYGLTLHSLLDEGKLIDKTTVESRNYLILEK